MSVKIIFQLGIECIWKQLYYNSMQIVLDFNDGFLKKLWSEPSFRVSALMVEFDGEKTLELYKKSIICRGVVIMICMVQLYLDKLVFDKYKLIWKFHLRR